jgi:tRNA pseudouridine32 synthase/23S rRNA pseudouridine746 synthase
MTASAARAVRARNGADEDAAASSARPGDSDATACLPVSVLHVDDHCIVAIKPAGLLSVPGLGTNGGDCLSVRIQARHPDALVVHRLDMATSGLVVFARGATAQRRLGIAFAARAVAKTYVAIVDGLVADDAGEIDLPLSADWPNRPRQIVDRTSGKPSLTRYRVLLRDAIAGRSRVELRPVTGRSHQLRVHLQALGHPIVGDALYGSERVQAGAERLLLHAAALRFPHPQSGVPLAFESAVPF